MRQKTPRAAGSGAEQTRRLELGCHEETKRNQNHQRGHADGDGEADRLTCAAQLQPHDDDEKREFDGPTTETARPWPARRGASRPNRPHRAHSSSLRHSRRSQWRCLEPPLAANAANLLSASPLRWVPRRDCRSCAAPVAPPTYHLPQWYATLAP